MATKPRVMTREQASELLTLAKNNPVVVAAYQDKNHPANAQLREYHRRLNYWLHEHPQTPDGRPVEPAPAAAARPDPGFAADLVAKLDRLTPEQAQARIAKLKHDPEISACLMDPAHEEHAETAATWKYLYKVAYPEPATAEADPAATDAIAWFKTGQQLMGPDAPLFNRTHPDHAKTKAEYERLLTAADPTSAAETPPPRPDGLPADLAAMTPAEAGREHRRMMAETIDAQVNGKDHPGSNPFHPQHGEYRDRAKNLLAIMETDPAASRPGAPPDLSGMGASSASAEHAKMVNDAMAAKIAGESHPGWDTGHPGYGDFQARAQSLLSVVTAPDAGGDGSSTPSGQE